jgi:hypothetical protein
MQTNKADRDKCIKSGKPTWSDGGCLKKIFDFYLNVAAFGAGLGFLSSILIVSIFTADFQTLKTNLTVLSVHVRY